MGASVSKMTWEEKRMKNFSGVDQLVVRRIVRDIEMLFRGKLDGFKPAKATKFSIKKLSFKQF